MYQKNIVYHLYNHTNNCELLFRERDNYLYFLRKVRCELTPYADILNYCLMPTHFHFMIRPTEKGLLLSKGRKVSKSGQNGSDSDYQQNLSHHLRVLLSSYTNAFNRRFGRRGSLLRAKTKAKPVIEKFNPLQSPSRLAKSSRFGLPYLVECFHYIHDNPEKAGLVQTATEWEFSSAKDYVGLRNGSLCNYTLTRELLGIERG